MTDAEIVMPDSGGGGRDDPPAGDRRVQAWTETPRWSVNQLVASWLAGLNNSERTRQAYKRDLADYLEWCGHVGVEPLRAKLPELQLYAHHLAQSQARNRHGSPTGRALSSRTQARRLNAVSSWYRYLVRTGTLGANPARELERPKWDRRYSDTRALSEAQARELLRLAPEATPRTLDPRCAALCLHLMIDLGLRVSEVCNLDLTDLAHHDGYRVVTVRGKGGTVRRRPIPMQLSGLLDAWRVRRPTDGDDPAALLVEKHGRRLAPHQVNYLVFTTARAAGIPEPHRVTPHSMRHTSNRIAAERGASIEVRQAALGHASVETTRLYDKNNVDLGEDAAHLVATATFTPRNIDDDPDTDEQETQ